MALSELRPAQRHRQIAAGFTSRVQGAKRWDAPSPVTDWTARDVVRHLVDEVVKLLSRRELAPDQQVGDLEEGRALGQLLDGVAAIAQDALVAVDIGNRRFAAGGGAITGIEGEIPQLGVQTADVQRGVAFGTFDNGQVQRFAGFGISESQHALGHRDTPYDSGLMRDRRSRAAPYGDHLLSHKERQNFPGRWGIRLHLGREPKTHSRGRNTYPTLTKDAL
jgi:hypothetical protein